jgi:hypothetical protein
VKGDVVGFIALDLIAWIIIARMKSVAFAPELLCVDPYDPATNSPSLRVPAHVIIDLELPPHRSLFVLIVCGQGESRSPERQLLALSGRLNAPPLCYSEREKP